MRQLEPLADAHDTQTLQASLSLEGKVSRWMCRLYCSMNCSDQRQVEYDKGVSAIGMSAWLVLFNVPEMVLLGRSLKKTSSLSVPKLFTLALSAVDCGFGVFTVVPTTVNYFTLPCGEKLSTFCHYLGFSTVLLMLMAQMVVMLMAIERFVALRYPFKYRQVFNSASALSMLIIVFVYSVSVPLLALLFQKTPLIITFKLTGSLKVAVSLIPLLGINEYLFFRNSWCYFNLAATSLSGRAFVIFFTVQALLSLVVLLYCNIGALSELYRMRKQEHATSSNEGSQSRDQANIFIASTLCVSAFYILFTTPMLIRLAFNQLGIFHSVSLDFIAMRLTIVNNILDSHLYFFLRIVLDKPLRQRCRKVFCAGCRCFSGKVGSAPPQPEQE